MPAAKDSSDIVSLVDSIGEGPKSIVQCNIGDELYKLLLAELLYRRENRIDYEKSMLHQRYPKGAIDRVIEGILSDSDSKEILATLTLLKGSAGLDYSLATKEQLLYFDKSIRKRNIKLNPNQTEVFAQPFKRRRLQKRWLTPVSFQDIQFAGYFSHVNVHNFILNYLSKNNEQITIVRFDAHEDFNIHGRGSLDKTNYFSYLLTNPLFSDRVERVISVGAEFKIPFQFRYARDCCTRDKSTEQKYGHTRCESYNFKGVELTFLSIFDLPTIQSPCLLDVDLDGHEYGQPFGQTGGFFYRPKELGPVPADYIESCQKYITIHPTVAARILRERIRNPQAAFVATERDFRQRGFWYAVEHDFLRELAS